MSLPVETQNKLLIALGYGYDSIGLFPSLEDDRPIEFVNAINNLLADLDDVESEIKAARQKSMAIELDGGTKVDFAKQIELCRYRGREIVNQLAQYAGLPVNWNRFGGNGKRRTVISPM